MILLLEEKKKVCPAFVNDLKGTRGKVIIHNVHSSCWGTGPDGKGDNRFGKILMRLRDRWFSPNHQSDDSTVERHEDVSSSKPELLIIGNSIVEGIKENKLSQEFTTKKKNAYTIAEAREVIKELNDSPNVIALQLITNDVKDTQPSQVLEEYQLLVSEIQNKSPDTKILISHAPHKNNNSKMALRMALVNVMLDDKYDKVTGVSCINNRNITSFGKDEVHPSRLGVSALARNLRNAVYTELKITAPSMNSSHLRN